MNHTPMLPLVGGSNVGLLSWPGARLAMAWRITLFTTTEEATQPSWPPLGADDVSRDGCWASVAKLADPLAMASWICCALAWSVTAISLRQISWNCEAWLW